MMHPPDNNENWVMGTPFKVDYYRHFAAALEGAGRLRATFLWHRAGYPEVPAAKASLKPWLGALTYASARYTNTIFAERLRFRLHPIYDRWMAKQLRDGDRLYSSYGYGNESFRRARKLGGCTILDGGNSHPQNFWDILTEENERWGVRGDPISRFHYERSLAMLEDTDFVVAPSQFVGRSFLERGFPPSRILKSFYPVDLSFFKPDGRPRPKDRPFTIINTSGLSLRKGTPYLFEAFRRLKQEIPGIRFLVTRSGNHSPVIEKMASDYSDLGIEWRGYVGKQELAENLRNADLFVLPSLEEGLVRTALQALACGVPVILSTNTGANDFVKEGINGSVVPIRNVDSIVESALAWWEKIRDGYQVPASELRDQVSPEAYARRVVEITSEIEQHA